MKKPREIDETKTNKHETQSGFSATIIEYLKKFRGLLAAVTRKQPRGTYEESEEKSEGVLQQRLSFLMKDANAANQLRQKILHEPCISVVTKHRHATYESGSRQATIRWSSETSKRIRLAELPQDVIEPSIARKLAIIYNAEMDPLDWAYNLFSLVRASMSSYVLKIEFDIGKKRAGDYATSYLLSLEV